MSLAKIESTMVMVIINCAGKKASQLLSDTTRKLKTLSGKNNLIHSTHPGLLPTLWDRNRDTMVQSRRIEVPCWGARVQSNGIGCWGLVA